ncbi:hypothetical protein NL676_021061 [Syzygium grande]|nr:hypothetical protein NL676_021061 [Syzygium grande]
MRPSPPTPSPSSPLEFSGFDSLSASPPEAPFSDLDHATASAYAVASEAPIGDFGGASAGGGDGGVKVCTFNNHGAGRSSVPADKSECTTKIMAKDVIAILDHLGWERAHVIGHSMRPMIAWKLAAMVPNRVLCLGLLNVTGGGYECFPKIIFVVTPLTSAHAARRVVVASLPSCRSPLHC